MMLALISLTSVAKADPFLNVDKTYTHTVRPRSYRQSARRIER